MNMSAFSQDKAQLFFTTKVFGTRVFKLILLCHLFLEQCQNTKNYVIFFWLEVHTSLWILIFPTIPRAYCGSVRWLHFNVLFGETLIHIVCLWTYFQTIKCCKELLFPVVNVGSLTATETANMLCTLNLPSFYAGFWWKGALFFGDSHCFYYYSFLIWGIIDMCHCINFRCMFSLLFILKIFPILWYFLLNVESWSLSVQIPLVLGSK